MDVLCEYLRGLDAFHHAPALLQKLNRDLWLYYLTVMQMHKIEYEHDRRCLVRESRENKRRKMRFSILELSAHREMHLTKFSQE